MNLVPFDTCDWCGNGDARPRRGVFLCPDCALEDEFDDVLHDAFADDGPQAPAAGASPPIDRKDVP